MIEIDALYKTYPDGTAALRGIDLEVETGEFVGLMGTSGAGKTTLFRTMTGALRPDRGTLQILGMSVPSLSAGELRHYRRQVGVVFQQHGLIPSLSVLHNVLLGRVGSLSALRQFLPLLYVPASEVEAVARTLSELELDVSLHRRAQDLSGGQQQRLAVARALWQSPRLLLADEPVASVDAETAQAIMRALVRRNREDGLTVVVSLHQHALAMEYCSRVVWLEQGQVVDEQRPAAHDGVRRADGGRRGDDHA